MLTYENKKKPKPQKTTKTKAKTKGKKIASETRYWSDLKHQCWCTLIQRPQKKNPGKGFHNKGVSCGIVTCNLQVRTLNKFKYVFVFNRKSEMRKEFAPLGNIDALEGY